MAEDYGTGVSRTLSALMRQFTNVVFQAGEPPLDAELNLQDQITQDQIATYIKSVMHSGFFLDPTRPLDDFKFEQAWANHFHLGVPRGASMSLDGDEKAPVIWANVNGWIIPVAGTEITTPDGTENIIKLFPPPSSTQRTDFVFLEVWRTLVAPNPSLDNKPTAATVWKYGNVKYGGTNITDDIEDPTVGRETTERVQIQYRIRVFGEGTGLGHGVALDVYPDGLDDPTIRGQGAAANPVTGFWFSNMREDLGDSSLWRSGDGDATNDLGTIDGYTYAIPICAIFRRNSGGFLAVDTSGSPNQNGGFNRTPNSILLTNPLDGSIPLTQVTLDDPLAWDTENTAINVTGLSGSGWDDPQHNFDSVYMVIDGEIIDIESVDVPSGTITIPLGTVTDPARGRYGTHPAGHPTDSVILFYNPRSDTLYSDEIMRTDILDLRRAINPGDWDYQRLLEHNVAALARGDLRTAWKQAGTGSTEGVVVHEVDYLLADGTEPNQTERLDGPDGIRTIWSDAAVIQPNVTTLLDDQAVLSDNGIGFADTNSFDSTVEWDVKPDFLPIGFMNFGSGAAPQSWMNGSIILLHIGGETGNQGARSTFIDSSDREVRFLTPREYWKVDHPENDRTLGNQNPVTIRFLNQWATEPPPESSLIDTIYPDLKHPGPMYPVKETDFQRPFIVLGGLLADNLRLENLDVDTDLINGPNETFEIDVGLDFDTDGAYKALVDGAITNDPSLLTNPLLRGERTLYGMLTQDGVDATGNSSEVYLAVYGDQDSTQNNGIFQVIGAGTATGIAGYTHLTAQNSTSLVVTPLSADFNTTTGFVITGNKVTVEFRSQYTNAEDGGAYQGYTADLCIGLTDIGGVRRGEHPWSYYTLQKAGISPGLPGTGNENTSMSYYPNSPPQDLETDLVSVQSKMLIGLTLLYHPGRSGMARVPDDVTRVALKNNSTTYLRLSPKVLDPQFTGAPTDPEPETYFDPVHVQVWNKLPACGWFAPKAPTPGGYGGNVVGFTEQDREHEVFFDKGSKTLVFRPFRDRELTIQALSFPELGIADALYGPYTFPGGASKDDLQLWTQANTGTYDKNGESETFTGAGKQMGFAVPREFMPRFGRQDIPYCNSYMGSPFLPGINHLFRDSTELTEPVFNVIGGEHNSTGGTHVTIMLVRTSDPSAYGQGKSGQNITATVSTDFLEGRKTSAIGVPPVVFSSEIVAALAAVNSSDLGRGLQGIQFPPYIGPARVIGVYDARDFDLKGGRTVLPDRYTPENDSAPNLLRTDADQQTLFILQDGAKDLTTDANDHTYIIPSEALDLSHALSYVDGDVFDDYEYIVAVTIFGFARGFINENNLVLVRRRGGGGLSASGAGTDTKDGDDPQLEGMHMCIPTAAGRNEHVYVGHNRTVYQGDPYMTRQGDARTVSDYVFRYGQISMSNRYDLATPLTQYDPVTHLFQIQTPNPRTFEVLASLDFYTTLGTGKIGGELFPGTSLDVGFLEATPDTSDRIPKSATAQPWRILPRAFTEGQITHNDSRGQVVIQLVYNEAISSGTGASAKFGALLFTLADGSLSYVVGTTEENNGDFTPPVDPSVGWKTFTVDEYTRFQHFTATELLDFSDIGTFPTAEMQPGETRELTVALPVGGDYNIPCTVNAREDFSNANGAVVFDARMSALDVMTIRAHYTFSPQAFENLADSIQTFNYTINGGAAIPANSSIFDTVSWPGAAVGDAVVMNTNTVITGLTVEGAVVLGADTIAISVRNFTSSPVTAGSPSSFFVALLEEQDLVGTGITVGSHLFDLMAVRSDYSLSGRGDSTVTARQMAYAINSSSGLVRNMTARATGSQVVIESRAVGAEGNSIHVEMLYYEDSSVGIENAFQIIVPSTNAGNFWAVTTSTNFIGGEDIPVNAGDGTSQLRLTGMTERLPLGILVDDHDFLCENPLGDAASAMQTTPAGIRPIQTLMPLTGGGEEYSRFLGAPGDLLVESDGAILTYGSLGVTRFRLFRGGGSGYVLSGQNPGGPIDWVSDTFPASSTPVLKGGALVCRALLVRNFYEEAFVSPSKISDGDEIQMVIITSGVFGDGNTQEEGVELSGIISPTGYGEGYAAADRYRIDGRPMSRGRLRVTPDPDDVVLAVYPDEERGN